MKKLQLLNAVAVIMGMCAAGSAAAQASGSVSLSNMSYTLFDLNPFDNIAPSVTFGTTASGYSWTQVGVADMVNNVNTTSYLQGQGEYALVQTSNSSQYLSGAAALSGGGTLNTTTLSASASASSNGSVLNSVYASAMTGQIGFTLSAMTGIVFQGDATAAAMTTVGYNGVNSEFAYGTSQILVASYVNSQYKQWSSTDQTYASMQSVWNPVLGAWQYTGQTAANSGAIDLSYLNLTAVDSAATVTFSASANAGSFALAVPEPETYAMLMAGLVLLGVAKRRRA